MRRPSSPPSQWSEVQAARWIRHLVRKGEVRFDETGHAEGRGTQRDISVSEMLKAIAQGTSIRKESHVVYKGPHSFDEERVTFRHKFNSHPRAVLVVAGISDEYPDCVIVTCMRGN